MKKKIYLSAVLLLVIAAMALGLSLFKTDKSRTSAYITEVIERGDIEALVVTTGTLNPVTVVEVGSQISGRIEEIFVDFNSEVHSGQVIAKIDQSSFQTGVKQSEANYQSAAASLEKAKVSLENLKKRYDRALELIGIKLISYEEKESAETACLSAKAELLSAEAKLAQAKSQLESSEVNLTYTLIKSPIDGIVIDRRVNIGQTVAASLQAPVLFQIADNLSEMKIECSVDEADIGKIRAGQKVKFSVDAFPEELFTGTTSQVRLSPEVIQNVVTYTTIVEVKNPDKKLLPGMTASVSIVIGEAENALLVPNSALRFTPPLSSEEMKDVFGIKQIEKPIISEFDGQTGNGRNRPSEISLSGKTELIKDDSESINASDENSARIWILDESGILKLIVLVTGVTDNSYTEVVDGSLEAGQTVITGLVPGTEKRSSSNNPASMENIMRMMR